MNSKLINVALGEYGVTEIQGSNHNPRVLEYFKASGHDWVKDDEMAWCSAFANYVAITAGYIGSMALNARSWLKVGIPTSTPQIGDVVVLWRESRTSWKGHVGFLIRETDTHVYILGGNQGNKVCITMYPKGRVLEYRRLIANASSYNLIKYK